VPGKGEVLTALNVFWRKHVFGILFPSDLVACGDAVDEFLPEA
ncbi:TPA: phosphoribosylaminoimidazolesuccinocarboxamide synthase, partial [Candidatus Uhrbacteria bacterium]|nr:phosphoribosylaminoimidazolesuccinocarboxamide synthase [Candidatus Uhrbacteria bacterium]